MEITEEDELAAHIDLSSHVNGDTGQIGDEITAAMIDHFGPEAAGEAQAVAMRTVARLVRQFDGQKLRISSQSTTVTAIRKDRARSLLADGASVQKVMRRTKLSRYHVTKVRRQLEADCSGGALSGVHAEA